MIYSTRYTHSNEEPVRITFGLVATLSANVIIVLQNLTAWKIILDLDENKTISKTMQLWLPLTSLDASLGLVVCSSYLSASDLVRPKKQTLSGKKIVIRQERVDIRINDGPRHENTPVTINSRWEDNLSNEFLERNQTQLEFMTRIDPYHLHVVCSL